MPCGIGVEVLSRNALEESYRLAETDEHTEHLDEWVLQHPQQYSILHHPVAAAKRSQKIHFTVDTPQDLQFLTSIHAAAKNIPSSSEVESLFHALEESPEMFNLKPFHIFVRADGNGEIGMGHLTRSFAILEELKKTIPSASITFFSNPEVQEYITQQGYTCVLFEPEQMKQKIIQERPQLILTDLRKHLDDVSSESLTSALRVRFIDTNEPQNVRGDLIINSFPLSQFETTGTYVAGLSLLPLRAEFQNIPPKEIISQVKSILVLLGGGDMHYDQILKLLEIIVHYPQQKWTIIVGSGMNSEHVQDLKQKAFSYTNITFLHNVRNIKELMTHPDIGISGGGNAIFEFACCGVPAISISSDYDYQHKDHQQMYCHAFEQAGTSLYLGHGTSWSTEKIQYILNSLIQNTAQRKKMAQAGQQLISANASTRIVSHILKKLVRTS